MKKILALLILLLLTFGCMNKISDISKTKVFKDDADLTGGLAKTKFAALLSEKLSSKFSGTGTTKEDITSDDLEELTTSLDDIEDLTSGLENDLDKLDFKG